ncbi:MAG: IS21 family transposase [Bacteroidales bacterium]|nr:IS21 family transposase [Bacteroidales bacterium]
MQNIDQIKELKYVHNLSYRQIQNITGHDRRTIKKWIKSNQFPEYKREKNTSPIKDRICPYIKQWIEEDQALIKKGQRNRIRTAATMHADLNRLGIPCSASTVRYYVSEMKPKEVFIPLSYNPGEDLQVDWGIYEVSFANEISLKVNLFVATLPYSNTRFVYPYIKADTMSFLDGHKKAFEFIGGIPKTITYDNLSSAVKKILSGPNREETDRMLHFKNFFDIQTNYCNVARGNEKGSVENGVGYVKRRYLQGQLAFNNFDELRKYLVQRCTEDLQQSHYSKGKIIYQLLKEEQEHLRPIPAEDFDISFKKPVVSSSTLFIDYDGVRYSIPSDYCKKQILLKATPEDINFYSGDKLIAYHKRTQKFLENEVSDFRHYLPVLLTKSRAVDKARCIKNADFPKVFWDYLKKLKQRTVNGNREMVKILLLHKIYDLKDIFFAIEWCLEHNSYSYDAVLMSLQNVTKNTIQKENLTKSYHQVKDYSTDLNKYDELLGGAYAN